MKLCSNCKKFALCSRYYSNNSSYAEICSGFEEKKVTNFDRIKAMSVEEMAELLERNANCEKYCVFTEDGVCNASGNVCLEGITRWLESEVQGE